MWARTVRLFRHVACAFDAVYNMGMTTADRIDQALRQLLPSDLSMGSLLHRAPFVLALCASKAASLPTAHLSRVGLTFGILRTVRCFFHFAKEDTGRLNTSDEKVFDILNERADRTATEVLDLIEKNATDAFSYHFRKTSQFLRFRSDLRFSEELQGDTLVPWSDDFPSFGPADIEDVSLKIADMTGQVLDALPRIDRLPPAQRDSKSDDNFFEMAIYYMALGKCVLTYWTEQQARFLDSMVCFVVDHEIAADPMAPSRRSRTTLARMRQLPRPRRSSKRR